MRIYINNRDLVTWPKRMAEKLAGQGHDVIFHDNASTYEPLLEFYENCPYEVVRSERNIGHLAVWQTGLLEGYTDPYVVTDPDLDIDVVPDDWPERLLYGCKIHGYNKCGLGLATSGLADREKEKHFLKTLKRWDVVEEGYYNQPIDTTFAVYTYSKLHKKNSVGDPTVVGGLSTDTPYGAKHLPWYLTSLDDEIYYYFKNARGCSTSLRNPYIQQLIEEWEKSWMMQKDKWKNSDLASTFRIF